MWCRFLLSPLLTATVLFITVCSKEICQQTKPTMELTKNHVSTINTRPANTRPAQTLPANTRPANTKSAKEAAFKELEQLLKGYNAKLPPSLNMGKVNAGNQTTTTIAEVNLFVYGIGPVDVKKMQFTVELLVRQRWTDARLTLPMMSTAGDLQLPVTPYKSQLWLPDLFFRNAKKGSLHKLVKPNELIWLKAGGQIVYSQKISLTLSCPMHFQLYPFDTQNCKIDMGSYAYTKSVLDFKWWSEDDDGAVKKTTKATFSNKTVDVDMTSAIKLRAGLKLTELDLVKHVPNYCRADFGLTGSFACLIAEFHLERQIGFYAIYGFLPSIVVFFVGWFSFLIDFKVASARVAMSTLAILTIVTQIGVIMTRLPPVAYLKAIDIWFGVCLLFGLTTLIEFGIVSLLNRRPEFNERPGPTICYGFQFSSWMIFLDRLFFVLYPILFVIFNIIYWSTFT